MLLAPHQIKVTNAATAAPAGTTTSATSRTKRIEKRPGWQRKLYPVEVGQYLNDFQLTPGPWWNAHKGTVFKDFYDDPAKWMLANRPEDVAPQLTVTEYAMIGELLRRGGLVKSSVWRVGQGARSKCAIIPPLADRFARDPNSGYATPPQYVQDYFDSNPRVKMVVAFYDMQYVRSLFLKATEHLLESVR